VPITFDNPNITFDQLITFDTTGLSTGVSMGGVSAKRFVSSIPSVLSAGGTALGMNSIILTANAAVPIGALLKFANATAVANFFGTNSLEAQLALVYFAGFVSAIQIPSALYFAQYNTLAVAGYLRGAALTGITPASLQSLSGTITLVIDGVSHTSAAINLASASSFSAAAALIQTGIQAGTPSSTATCTYDSTRNAFVILSSTTGSASVVGFPTPGTLTTGLLLTQAAGAVQSPGAAAATPSGLMTPLSTISQDWATFMLSFDPDGGTDGGPIKVQFAQWNAGQGEYYAFVAWDNAALPSTEADDTSCFAQAVSALEGTIPIWSAAQGPQNAAFLCGYVASINFQTPGGRTNAAFRSSPALAPDVTSDTIYGNVTSNGYNCYASVATRTQQFQWFQPGVISGTWKYIDSYVNQIYWNALFQADYATFLNNAPSVPYTQQGFAAVRGAISSDITAMGSFGAWAAGGELSGAQSAEVNAACGGLNVAPTIESQGWYQYVADPGPTVRAARGSPINKFFYFDGESVQMINMASTDVQ
jgi:Protein of unknown function (DUF3383)